MSALSRPGILFDGISGFDSEALFTFLNPGPQENRHLAQPLLGKASSLCFVRSLGVRAGA